MYEIGGNPKYITAVAEVTTDGVSVGTVFDSTGKERVSGMPVECSMRGWLEST